MRRVALIFAIFFSSVTGAFADPPSQTFDRSNAKGNQLVLRVAAEDAQAVAEQYGLELLDEWSSAGTHLVLVDGPQSLTAGQIEALVQGDARIASTDRIQLASLPDAEGQLTTSNLAADLASAGPSAAPCVGTHFSTPLWSGFAGQSATELIQLPAAHELLCGSATVAVLDTGVDPDHPALAGALVPGFDFLQANSGTPSEWDFLNGSLQPILGLSAASNTTETDLTGSLQPILGLAAANVEQGQGTAVVSNTAIAPIVDPAMVSEIEGLALPPYFGHGTMTAGLIRLTAPGAQIMPLRVFDAWGTAHLFDILAAIYYAVDHGADVISMSFSISESSHELKQAIQYARNRGVVCVVATGNDGQAKKTYPAAYSSAIGVAATNLDDQLSPFSNYGASVADLSAPGVGVVSIFPGGLYAAGWGTSFSAPLVAGAAALIRQLHPGDNANASQDLVKALEKGSVNISELAGTVRKGRLDVLAAVIESTN